MLINDPHIPKIGDYVKPKYGREKFDKEYHNILSKHSSAEKFNLDLMYNLLMSGEGKIIGPSGIEDCVYVKRNILEDNIGSYVVPLSLIRKYK